MYTVIRTYPGQPNLAKELKKHHKDIEKIMSSTPGFSNYYLLEIPDGVAAVTVCDSRSGCEESTRRAAEWLDKNVPSFKVKAPHVVMGEVLVQFDRAHAHA
jgi:hypothetical protein